MKSKELLNKQMLYQNATFVYCIELKFYSVILILIPFIVDQPSASVS
jgi:hypothetical protein